MVAKQVNPKLYAMTYLYVSLTLGIEELLAMILEQVVRVLWMK